MPVKKTGKIYAKEQDGTYYQIMPEEPDYQGATEVSAGKAGFVPAPEVADRGKYLRGDGVWNTLSYTELADKPTTIEHADDADSLGGVAAANYALKADLTEVYEYKGSVESYVNLPASNNKTGDVYDVQDTGMNYAWNGSRWDPLGQLIDFSTLVPTSRTVNGHALSGNISITASDVGAATDNHVHAPAIAIVNVEPTSANVSSLADTALIFYPDPDV